MTASCPQHACPCERSSLHDSRLNGAHHGYRPSTRRAPRPLREEPADLDEYWREALGELRLARSKEDPQFSRVDHPADHADCFDVRFTGVRGARLHEAAEQMWLTLGYIDVQHLTPRSHATLVMLTGLIDAVCPPSTRFAAFNKVTSERSVLIYPDFEHEDHSGVGDHLLRFHVGELQRAPRPLQPASVG